MLCEENYPVENSGQDGTQVQIPDGDQGVTQEKRDRINEAAMKGNISPELAGFLTGDTETTGTAKW